MTPTTSGTLTTLKFGWLTTSLGSAHTRRHLPVTLVWHQEYESRVEALEMERRVKGWRREKKAALIEGRMEDLRRLSSRAAGASAIVASRRRNRDD